MNNDEKAEREHKQMEVNYNWQSHDKQPEQRDEQTQKT